MTTIDDIIARIPTWQSRDIHVAPLSGGLTNTNYRVEVDGAAYVVRIPGQSTELLSVNREHEYQNTLAAAQAGVGARIVHYLPDIPRMARSVRMLHAGPHFANEFNMFRTMDFYLEIVRSQAIRIPDGYMEYVP